MTGARRHLPEDEKLRYRVRAVVNWVNLSTPLGLLIAHVGAEHVERHRRRTYLATGYRLGFPAASAFVVGSVVITPRSADRFLRDPGLVAHEDRHVTQYAFFLGPVMLACYVLAAGLSWLISGSPASYNPFERFAGLADGRYPPPQTRLAQRRARRTEPRSRPPTSGGR